MSTDDPFRLELAKTLQEFPAFVIEDKADSAFMRLLSKFLFFVPDFMTAFVTCIGTTMWVPEGWRNLPSVAKAVMLVHERTHMRQQRAYGTLMYFWRYLCWPLPLYRATGRAALERDAYMAEMEARAEYTPELWTGAPAYRQAYWSWLEKAYIDYFTGPSYGWMVQDVEWVRAWYWDKVAELTSTYAPTGSSA